MVSGMLLLVNPSMDTQSVVETSMYLVYRYWPLTLIIIGVFLQSTGSKKKR